MIAGPIPQYDQGNGKIVGRAFEKLSWQRYASGRNSGDQDFRVRHKRKDDILPQTSNPASCAPPVSSNEWTFKMT
jgi:hypothetical protein